MWILLVPLAIGFIWLVYEFLTAPEGYEDNNGYHSGRKGGNNG